MEDFVGLMRRLWRGEIVTDHDGPAGRYPFLRLDQSFDEHIPITFTAFGPNSLAFGGRACDAVVLHTFFSDETTERCVRQVKQAAEEAGRDPNAVRVWSCFATIADHVPEDVRLKKTVGRLATYLQAYGDLMVRTNNWDPAPLENFRAAPIVREVPGAIDQVATTAQLELIAELIPPLWLESAATGTAEQCASAVQHQLDLGCDGVILHGAAPDDLATTVAAYRQQRNAAAYDHLPANPALAPV